jgi:hypothetical protein
MRIVVFLGPSLTIETAKEILPDAMYCEPCRCGDLIKVLRLHPDRILVVDGYFCWTPAPWHKEFLLALELGVQVYAASSMGALRAAELHQFGVIGVGRIYEDFVSGRIDGDDEVAVTHSDQNFGYHEFSDALINIRYTLEKAISTGQVNGAVASDLVSRAQRTHFPDRDLQSILDEYSRERGEDLSALREWLGQGNFVNQKRLDAIEALRRVRDDPPRCYFPRTQTNYTRYIRQLFRWASCSPFQRVYEWLPESEAHLARMCASDPSLVEVLFRVAEGLMYAIDVSKTPILWPADVPHSINPHSSNGTSAASELIKGWELVGDDVASASQWLAAQAETIGLDWRVIDTMAAILEKLLCPASGIMTGTKSTAIGSNEEQTGRNAIFQRAIRTQALLILSLASLARARGLTVKQSLFEKEIAIFRVSSRLEDPADMKEWLSYLSLEQAEFAILFFDYVNYKYVFSSDRADALLESRPAPMQFALGNAFDCVKAGLANN